MRHCADRLRRLGLASLLLWSPAALAAPPGPWSIGLERLFGVSHSWATSDTGKNQRTTSLGFGLAYLEPPGYSSARIGTDHLFEPGLSVGGAFGYARDARHDTESDLRAPLVSATKDYWLLSPRIGYLLQPLPAFAFWPRAGVMLLMPGHANTRNNAAVSLELPLIGLLPGVPVGISATPHFDLGFSPAHEGKLSELGLSFAAHVFF